MFVFIRSKATRLFIIITVYFSVSNALIFECNFSNKSWPYVGTVYQCKAKLQKSDGLTDLHLQDVEGKHSKGMINSNVEALEVKNQDINRIPSNINAFFANIKALQWQKSKMLTITNDDLEQFPNLIYLDLESNLFTSLESELFSGTRHLAYISFSSNKLEQIGFGLLTGLDGLTEAWFQSNPCINRFETTQGRMSILNQLLSIECPSSAATKTTTERNEKTTQPSPPKAGCSQGCMEHINMLTITLEDLEAQNILLERSVVAVANELIASNAEHNVRFTKYESRINELEKQRREIGSQPCSPC